MSEECGGDDSAGMRSPPLEIGPEQLTVASVTTSEAVWADLANKDTCQFLMDFSLWISKKAIYADHPDDVLVEQFSLIPNLFDRCAFMTTDIDTDEKVKELMEGSNEWKVYWSDGRGKQGTDEWKLEARATEDIAAITGTKAGAASGFGLVGDDLSKAQEILVK